MGYGDELMGTGLARGAADRGKRIAFGDGRRIIWSQWSEAVFRHNPNVARPGDERDGDLEWIKHHVGSRLYNRLDESRTRWIWNMDFRAVPGEVFFSPEELQFAQALERGFVLIEPNLPRHKSVRWNKDWGRSKYQSVATRLLRAGHRVVQFGHGHHRLKGVGVVSAPDFRHALAVLARAALYIGPEGGLHHGAAAVGIPAIVLFGGFIPPQVTGYDGHANLTGGAEACGSLTTCRHCTAAMDAITVDEVCAEALSRLTAVSAPRNEDNAAAYQRGASLIA